ncbi:luciferin sulfotransferase-like [Clytia hemisphaerica]|uniref:Sulfotransferase domain-containing protein n=1 Tax=Clytia hemisphaerica TaxID=252671 RepID=A0A7M5X9A2_9CNID
MEIKQIPINNEDLQRFNSDCYTFKEHPLSMLEPYHQVFPSLYMDHHKSFQEAEVYEDDVWICTFPKSGTRWMQEIVSCLRNGLDFEKAKSSPLGLRVPFFDFSAVSCNAEKMLKAYGSSCKTGAELVNHTLRPRTIKTHLSYEMLPPKIHEKGAKMINVIRNPRDVCVSFLNHHVLTENYTGDLQTIAEIMLQDVGPIYAPFFTHILSYWNQRENPNLLIVHYEEMQKDVTGVIKRVAKFIGTEEYSDGQIAKLVEHTSVDKMRANPMVNVTGPIDKLKAAMKNEQKGTFINTGKTGGWKNKLTEETIERFKKWEEKWLKDTGLLFVYEV